MPIEAIDRLTPRMLSDAAALSARLAFNLRGANGNGHLQMSPPKIAPWYLFGFESSDSSRIDALRNRPNTFASMFGSNVLMSPPPPPAGPGMFGLRCLPELVANPLIEQVAAAVLGRSARPRGAFHPAVGAARHVAWLGFHNGNCATPFAGPHAGNSGYQGLHTDGGWCYKTQDEAAAAGATWPPLTTCLHVNFCMVNRQGLPSSSCNACPDPPANTGGSRP